MQRIMAIAYGRQPVYIYTLVILIISRMSNSCLVHFYANQSIQLRGKWQGNIHRRNDSLIIEDGMVP